jgi:hypothetical protein
MQPRGPSAGTGASRWVCALPVPGPDPARPQQFHLDLGVGNLDKAQQEVLDLGAALLDVGDGRQSWRIFADSAGYPFCLIRD